MNAWENIVYEKEMTITKTKRPKSSQISGIKTNENFNSFD